MAFDKFKEECGLMAIYRHKEASNLCHLGLHAQQHRGQEGVGVISQVDGKFHAHKGIGLVSDNFADFDFKKLPGDVALGHVRYSTAGDQDIVNVQPLVSELSFGNVAVAHNGNLTNFDEMKEVLKKEGAIFSSNADSEIVLHLLSKEPASSPPIEALISAVTKIEGAFSLIVLFKDRIFALRDKHGFRPLSIGKIGDSYVFASETCAFGILGAKFIRDIKPGEIVELTDEGELKSYFPFGNNKSTPCIFEHVYFARPNSKIFGRQVYKTRLQMGRELAKENPVEADLVVPVPDSGVPAALGYSQESGIEFQLGLIRSHYVGRTFIEPKQSIRDFGVKIKHSPNDEIIEGKRLVLIDDSIVRGTTSKKLINMLKKAGAKEVHLMISSPPITDPCYYGIDTPEKSQLIAANKSIEEIREYLEVDSLTYLSVEGLYKSVESDVGSYCDACFTGNRPVKIKSGKKDSEQLGMFS